MDLQATAERLRALARDLFEASDAVCHDAARLMLADAARAALDASCLAMQAAGLESEGAAIAAAKRGNPRRPIGPRHRPIKPKPPKPSRG